MSGGDGIERRIVTGIIVSADFVRRVRAFWNDAYIGSPELRRVARWGLDHFEKYGKPLDSDLQTLFYEKLKTENIPKDEADFIEQILTKIGEEYGRGDQFNASYLYDKTAEYLRSRELEQTIERISDHTERGQLDKAEAALREFKPQSYVTSRGLDVGSEAGLTRLAAAFDTVSIPVVTYPGDLGDLLNLHLVRGGFVAFLANEKRGKTFYLIDLSVRALRQRSNVAFFQAGDMTESQFLRRLAIHIAHRSDDPKYCVEHWRPVGDCVLNQYDKCNRSDRNCDFGVRDDDMGLFYSHRSEHENKEQLVDLADDNPTYQPCKSKTCRERRPTVWLQKEPAVEPLTGRSAARHVGRFFDKYKRRFRLVTYPSGSLTAAEMESCLDEWERQDDFVPDLIVVDYADLMTASVGEFRHRQDAIWMGLRGTSQKRHALLATATQADAAALKQIRLNATNFSEDKRKLAHVTAMFGMHQAPDGREKALGLMRFNAIVAREGAFSTDEEVVVLQDISSGRPFLESYSYRPIHRPSVSE